MDSFLNYVHVPASPDFRLVTKTVTNRVCKSVVDHISGRPSKDERGMKHVV